MSKAAIQKWLPTVALLSRGSGPVQDIEELTGGITNINLKVRYDDGTVVVRVAQPGTELLAIDRAAENYNSRAAATAGVGAPVVEFHEDPVLLVVGFLDSARTLDDAALREPGMLTRIAGACRVLHAGPRFVNDFNMFDIQRRYQDTVLSRGFRLPGRYLEFGDQVTRIERALAARPVQTVPCHNDLLAENMLDDGEKIWFVDYELSGNNDPYFELGNIWSEGTMELGYLDDIVGAYDGRATRNNIARARLWGLMSKYGWMLWAAIQDSVSSIDFDFWTWGLEKYDRAIAEFDGPDFERLLAEAAGAD